MTETEVLTRNAVSFGPFRLVASERLLTKGVATVELGARALDILIALVSRPNEAVSKRALLEDVWPDMTVGEGSLRFHIAALRRALGDGEDGARYITTLAGRGYCFVAPVSQSIPQNVTNPGRIVGPLFDNVPSRLARMVGRDDGVLALARQVVDARFVTIVGAGGVGKTTVAVAVGHELIETFAGAVLFVDLGALSDPSLVAGSIASMLGLSVQAGDPVAGLIAYLRDKRLLLILDTCEHLIEAAAALTDRIFAAAPLVHLLTTSREALRVEGEHVHRLEPLAFPPEDPRLTAAEAVAFSAIQLFMERVEASGARLKLSDTEAATVAGICRRLDGLALAIELVAGRVGAYGLEVTAMLLEERLSLLWSGRRTAPPRQQTLKAMLDWSYELLSDVERRVLRQLAVFIGSFTLDAAQAVLTSASLQKAQVLEAIESLIAKSMVAVRPVGATMRYRLLDTTRAYALETSLDEAERVDVGARHAAYYRRWSEQVGPRWSTLASAAERGPYMADLANVRTALDWAFGANGRLDIGVSLAAAAAPVFLAMSLLPECHRWSDRALQVLGGTGGSDTEEMKLQAALGMSLTFLQGMSDAARAALNRSLAIGEAAGDALHQLQLLGQLHMFHVRTGNFNAALECARRSEGIARLVPDPAAAALAHSFLGISLSYLCDLEGARTEIEAALRHGAEEGSDRISLGFNHYSLAASYLARVLWLQGYPSQAVARARQTVKHARGMDHPVTLCIALIWTTSMFLWVGDLSSAEEHASWLESQAETYALAPYLALARGYKGELAIRRGNPHAGVEMLRRCLADLSAVRHAVLATPFNIALAQGLAATGRSSEGLALLDEIVRRIETNGDICYLPEVLRVKGAVMLSMSPSSTDEAENWLRQSLELSRRKRARAWELRAANDLAALLVSHGDHAAARTLLQPVLGQFEEGFETADLQAAERLR